MRESILIALISPLARRRVREKERKRRSNIVVSTTGSRRRIKQGILGIAEGRGGCPVGTARHPPRPWVGRADEHTDPLFPTEKVGDQAQAWSKGLARGLAHLSNHRVFGNSPVCVIRDCTVSESCPETWSGKEGAVGQHGSACQVC